MIDYFLVSPGLAEVAEATVQKAPWSTHLCAALVLDVQKVQLTCWQAVVPKALPDFPLVFKEKVWERALRIAKAQVLGCNGPLGAPKGTGPLR